MRQPFIFGTIRKKDLSPLTQWKFSNSGRYRRLKRGKSILSIRKRETYPITFIFSRGNEFLAGYAESQIYEKASRLFRSEGLKTALRLIEKEFSQDPGLEFFFVAVDLKGGFVNIIRDALCTIPVFYRSNRNGLAFSNEFSALPPFADGKKIKLDFQGLSSYLLALESADKTIFADIKILTERSSLRVGKKDHVLSPPKGQFASRKISSIRGKNVYRRFEQVLEKTLTHYWYKIPKKTRIAFELSGGLDSSAVAGFYSKKFNKRLPTFSLVLPGGYGKSQTKKIRDFSGKFDLESRLTPINGKIPLSNQLTSKKLKPFYPWREIYYEALSAMISRARKNGIEVMFTGVGGDELFQIDPREETNFQGEEEIKFRKNLPLPSFFTKKFRSNFLKNLPYIATAPASLVPYSVLGANASRNNVFVERGIWPIAPLGDPTLVCFCRSLPAVLRARKKILRDYQRKNGYPSSIYDAKINESFTSFFDNSIRGPLKKFLLRLYKNSILDNLGLIKKEKLIEEYQAFRKNESIISPLYFYSVAVIEIVLQSLKSSRR